jgi:hypothetical protein
MTETLLSEPVALPVAIAAVLGEYGESLYEVCGGLAGAKGKLLVGGVEVAVTPSSTVESLLSALAAKGVTEGSYGVEAGFGVKEMPYPMVTEMYPVFALAA